MTESSTTNFYAAAGVNVKLGDRFSALSKRICAETWANSPYVRVRDYAKQGFRGPRSFSIVGLPPQCEFDLGSDGVGTKVGMVTAAQSHGTCGYDLIAMKAMDRTRWGGLPLVATNVLDVKTLGDGEDSPTYQALAQLIEGMHDAADEIDLVLFGGETAELGVFVGSEDPKALTAFNWSGAVLGAIHPDKVITGQRMQPGDLVMALRDPGVRSNGVSTIRKALKQRFGDEWWSHPDAMPWIKDAALPSKLYDKFLCTMHGWFNPTFEPVVDMKCIAHITGGGIPGKFFDDILQPLGLSADLDDLWRPPAILRACADWYTIKGEPMPDRQCYETWHGGQGALVVIDPADEPVFLTEAAEYGIEARRGGVIRRRETPTLLIKSKFRDGDLTWP